MTSSINGVSPSLPQSQAAPPPSRLKGKPSIVIEILKGGALGAGVSGLITPLIYLTNMLMIPQRPVLKHCFSGVGLNSFNVIPQTALQMTTSRQMMNRLFPDKEQKKPLFLHELFVAAFAGACSSLVTTPGELLVQNCQKLSGMDTGLKANTWFKEAHQLKEIARRTYQAGGTSRFFVGTAAVGAREALWAMTYMALAPAIVKMYASRFGDNLGSDIAGAATAGAFGGVVTGPPQYLRVQKQNLALEAGKIPSYLTIIRSASITKLFTAVHVRSGTVAVACVLMTLGKKILYGG